jgi:DNA-binding CsgD family transcriptional regulator
MVALFERPNLKKRNTRILDLFVQGELSRKEIAAQFEVSLDVVNNVIKAHRAEKKHGRRRCSCGARR